MSSSFSFEGHIEDAKPFIPFEAFESLKVGQIVKGTINTVVQYASNDRPTAEVLVGTHVTNVTLWDHNLDSAKELIGSSINLQFRGMTPHTKAGVTRNYPKFAIRW